MTDYGIKYGIVFLNGIIAGHICPACMEERPNVAFFLSLITSPISIAIILIVIIYLKHRGGLAALPEHLKWQIHKDYSFILQLIPRTLTSYNLFRPPRMLVGYNVTDFWWLNGKKGAHPIQRYLNGKRFFMAHQLAAVFLACPML